jgi:NAD(P)H-nitrite reductase large subunit
LRLQTELENILDENNDSLVDSITTKSGEKINCQFVGLTVGVSPNVDFLKNSDLNINRGILVNDYLETNIIDVYAIGDCAEIQNPYETRKAIEAVWYTGRMMGETVATTICIEKTKYNPGIWFNSAKFLDIEYQVYGNIQTKPDEQTAQIYWEDAKTSERAIRIQFDKNSRAVLGFNLMGVRYRHEVCEKWIANKTSIEQVLQNLSLANFDPEFYRQPEAELIAQYNAQNNTQIKNTSQRDLNEVIEFLRI